MSTSTTEQEHSPSFTTKLLGFCAFNGLFLTLFATITVLLVGSLMYPRTIGLYLVLPYVTYTFVSGDEHKDGNHWSAFSRNFILFTWMRRMLGLEFALPLPPELVRAEKEPNAQFVIGLFPHGVMSDYRILMDGILEQVLPNVSNQCRTLSATVLFRLPGVCELALWTGCVDARRCVAQHILENGRSLLVCPGGEAEQIQTTRGKEIVYLKNRKGFIKLAMRQGVPVVPCYAFGVSDYYHTSHALFGPRNWLVKNLGVCIPLAIGMWGSPFCPMPVKTTLVLGKPLLFQTMQKRSPTQQELDLAHEQFCKELVRVFDEHKTQLGYGDRTLEIV